MKYLILFLFSLNLYADDAAIIYKNRSDYLNTINQDIFCKTFSDPVKCRNIFREIKLSLKTKASEPVESMLIWHEILNAISAADKQSRIEIKATP